MPRPRAAVPSYSIGFRTDPDTHARARLLAAARCMPLADLMREALRQLLEGADDLPTLPPTRNAA